MPTIKKTGKMLNKKLYIHKNNINTILNPQYDLLGNAGLPFNNLILGGLL